MKLEKILIDTDMGNDDIMAISMLLLSSRVQIKGITLTNGLSTINKGLKNISKILKYCGETIPVIKGYNRKPDKVIFPEIDIKRSENLSLLAKLDLQKENILINNQSETVEEFIYSLLSKEKITILALGPLTNIARLIKKYPYQAKNIKNIIIMGGGLKKGNIPPANLAEYNIALDPKSANIVFQSGIPITMVGIDATYCAPATQNFKQEVKKINPTNPKTKIIKEIIVNNDGDFNYFYDSLAAYILINPSVINKKIDCSIKIVLKGQYIGKTIANKNGKNNVSVVLKIKNKNFYNYIFNLLTKRNSKDNI